MAALMITRAATIRAIIQINFLLPPEFFPPFLGDWAAGRDSSSSVMRTASLVGASDGAAKKVADAMTANGWEFASHTWGHKNATDSSAEELKADDEKWEAYVAPILGKTDTIIFAFGADIGGWEGYSFVAGRQKRYSSPSGLRPASSRKSAQR